MEQVLNNFLLFSSVILFLSILLSKSSSRFGLPILVLFLFIGMLCGSEGLGGIYFDNYELTHSLSLIALCLIIFCGGIDTKLKDIEGNLKRGVFLSSFGVVITALIIAGITYLIVDVGPYESLLLGAILSATDAAAVIAVFKDKSAQVSSSLKMLLTFESGSNDPMAYFLVTLFLGFIEQGVPEGNVILLQVVFNPLFGLLVGWLCAKAFITINNYINLEHLGLYPALTLSFLFFNYSFSTMIGGNGFLAVYVFGVILGNQKIVHKNVLYSFYDGVSWLSQIGLFVMLGLLVFPSRLVNVALPAVIVAVCLILIARPLAVFLCLLHSKFNMKQKVFISWAGLKGASPIVFACFAATHLGKRADIIFDIVFFVVLISALVQGSTIKWLAKKLGLLIEVIDDPDFPVDMELLSKTREGIFEYQVKNGDFSVGKRIVDIGLPSGTWILFIKREGRFIIPDGSSTLNEADKILVVTKNKNDTDLAKMKFLKEETSIN